MDILGWHVCLCPAEGPEVTEVEVEDTSAFLGPHRNPSTKLHRQNLHCNAKQARIRPSVPKGSTSLVAHIVQETRH